MKTTVANERIHDMYRPLTERRMDYTEVERLLTPEAAQSQAGRCMNCGIPFCHGSGCPLANVIPEFNEAVANDRMLDAYRILSETSFFPEFTSRVCPALCEGSCVHGIADEAVMIRQIEKRVIDTAYENDWVQPVIPLKRNGGKVAVIGAGPAGLAAAEALNRAGFTVTVYEANRKAGGLMRYGIPDFKLAKKIIERRIGIMEKSGISFVMETRIGKDISCEYLKRRYDALVLATGTPVARDLPLEGRDLNGIHFALELLRNQNRINSGEDMEYKVNARGKRVLVIGGGDTGSDCVGTSLRQGAASVLQIEIMPRPPEWRSPSTPWPDWPYLLRTSSSHMEGGERRWNLATQKFTGENGRVTGVEVSEADWEFSPSGRPLKPHIHAEKTEFIPADLILLAMGFTGAGVPGKEQLFDLKLTRRNGFIPAPEQGIFAVGDCKNGASLVVRAIADGKAVAEQVSRYPAKK